MEIEIWSPLASIDINNSCAKIVMNSHSSYAIYRFLIVFFLNQQGGELRISIISIIDNAQVKESIHMSGITRMIIVSPADLNSAARIYF